ncbi:ATP-dependent RNA helicase [Corynebacterium sp. HMSC29G08]|uniref:ATP-dependent RNA helicase n=1 Tax=Corynebacterium sp. HMSC29G08 TaxID=1581069 RepID=UPI0008A2CFC4|nr:ATP-dependent helicase C-terminal domain-containing protein [Corynebacterium sp. HMSC29G08]OFT84031.1 ATP-dependent helicase HrpB [Corynebacterium sp. HMSC29G08]
MFDLEKIGRGLPVAGVLGQLPEAGPLVVEAPPGTGKTTLIPPAVANAHGKTLVTAPRRVAVRAAFRRLSLLDDAQLSGYAIRGEAKRGELVEFVTPGVLLNRLLKDPELRGVNAVILDEVHERQLDTDLALAMCMEVAILRDDFFLTAMSATLDATAFAHHMGAHVVSTQAETYPLEVQYAPHAGRASGTKEFYEHVASLAARPGKEPATAQGRTLVFVPGVREVELVCEALHKHGVAAAPLHGRLTSEQQDQALYGDAPVVVSTAVAESSVTVPGVRKVVDAGLSREPRRDARGMTGLVTVSASKASANQRAGRAARLGPGTVVRAYSEADYQHFREDIAAEITTSDLTAAVLMMKAWGSPDLPLLTSPQAAARQQAEETLEALGALNNRGEITDFGRALAALPVDPRLGAALLKLGSGAAPTVAAIAEGLSGDLSRVDPPRNQVTRLAKLAPKGPPVAAGEVVSTAFPQWVAKRMGEEYLLASGTRATLDPKINLTGAEWIAAAEVQRTKHNAVIRAAAATQLPTERITQGYRAHVNKDKVQLRKVKAIGAIELSATPVALNASTNTVAASEALEEAAASFRFEDFLLDSNERDLLSRLTFLHEQAGWPDISRGDYAVEVGEVLRGASISKCDMRAAMMRNLPWELAGKLEQSAPERLAVPSGSRPKISYETGRPVVRVKLQECFGLATSPVVSGVRVLFHLLSPAGRELAVTDDLRSFWDGPYQQVRKDMRGRYPKHPWPEDPWSAKATAKTKNKM